MFPGARLTDPITHDQLVPSGFITIPAIGRIPTVLTEKAPAAVMTDYVTCTGVTSAGPIHPPQLGAPPTFLPPPPMVPISKGSATVMIQKKPAARWMVDFAGCGVFLGDAKMMATRTVKIGG